MDNSSINLGYTVRRAIGDSVNGLRVFRHDLSTFCIPKENAILLSDVYKRYLWASGILKDCSEPERDAELYECDRQSLVFIHERANREMIDGQFFLEDAIEFVEAESGLPKAFAIRWCMMMEFITYEDQRLTLNQTNQDKAAELDASHYAPGILKDKGTQNGN